MKSLLNEIVNPNTAVLTDTQKAILCLITVSSSPKMAFDGTNASKNFIHAAGELNRLQMISIRDNSVEITQLGKQMMQHHNLADGGNMLTQDGKDILSSSQEVGRIFNGQSVQESFDFLKSLG
jgi:hypothetical protein